MIIINNRHRCRITGERCTYRIAEHNRETFISFHKIIFDDVFSNSEADEASWNRYGSSHSAVKIVLGIGCRTRIDMVGNRDVRRGNLTERNQEGHRVTTSARPFGNIDGSNASNRYNGATGNQNDTRLYLLAAANTNTHPNGYRNRWNDGCRHDYYWQQIFLRRWKCNRNRASREAAGDIALSVVEIDHERNG